MAGGIYSTRFCLGSTAAAVEFKVPAGKVAVIKSITAVNTSPNAQAASISLAGVYIWYGSLPGLSTLVPPGLMIVANAGETLLFGGSAAVHVHASGYLLDRLATGP